MINNIDVIKSLLHFESEDVFFHLQIIKRKKEHPELGSNSLVVKTYCVRSFEHLDRIFPEVQCLCDFHNARAYINLNARSFEKLAFHNLKKVTDCIMNKDYISVKQSYDAVCGSYMSESNKKWIIDIDTFDKVCGENIIEEVNAADPNPGQNKVLAIIPTLHGYHIITEPFNVLQTTFCEVIQKNNPTILYIK